MSWLPWEESQFGCHAGPSGEVLRTLSLDTNADTTGVTSLPHSQRFATTPSSCPPCRHLPTLHEGFNHVRSSEKGKRHSL